MDFNPDLLMQLLEQDLSTPLGGVSQYRAEMLRKSILKKYVPPGKELSLQKLAFDKFVGINESVGRHIIDSSFLESEVFHLWRGLLHKSLLSDDLTGPSVTLSGCIGNGLQGPGVTNGNDDTLFFTKMFNSHLTTSSEFLYVYYRENLSRRWRLAEAERLQHHSVKVVPGSVLGTVRKDRDEDRTTCKEPTLNMFYQLGAKVQFENVLINSMSLDIANQPFKNQYLAKRGSIDGSFATLDLKSASDSISIDLVQKLLPKSVFNVLMKIRSPYAHVGKELVKLNMISTMGNGFTFALMTLIFACLVKAVYIKHGIRAHFGSASDRQKSFTARRNGRVEELYLTESKFTELNCAVFGDDIIVLSQVYNDVVQALTSSGFTVNEKKSFSAGPFRESCGGDFFNGFPVRGVYIKRMNHEANVYSAFNRLHLWSIRSGIPLERTLRYLMGMAQFRPIPINSGIDEGFLVTHAYTSVKRSQMGGFWYKHLKPSPERITRCGERFMYHNAGLITMLGGYITNDVMLRRVNNPRYIVASSYTPSWDYSPYADLTSRDLEISWDSLIS